MAKIRIKDKRIITLVNMSTIMVWGDILLIVVSPLSWPHKTNMYYLLILTVQRPEVRR